MISSCGYYLGSSSLLGGAEITSDGTTTSSLIAELLKTYSYYDYNLTDEQLARAIVAGYAEITGDLYAYYYNAEEFAALSAENNGENKGIGITIIENTDHSCIEVISVISGAPADKAGLQIGDLIVQVGVGEKAEMVADIGYEMAIKKLQGALGEACEFGVVRNGDFDNIIEFSVIREEYTAESVLHSVSVADPTVGIVKILGFDLTTPPQFKAAMNDLISKGCTSFIYDVRNNPGGDLASVSAVLSYLLNKDDVIIITEDNAGNTTSTKCGVVASNTGDYASCNVAEEEIGMYRKYPAAVLINGSSASAAELFTGSLKSYGLATIVGEKSFGKGCMQSIIPLSYYNASLSGAIKMTTKYYRPHGMDNYHGIGIEPTEGYNVKISEEAAKINIYKIILPENQVIDNQLALAITAITK